MYNDLDIKTMNSYESNLEALSAQFKLIERFKGRGKCGAPGPPLGGGGGSKLTDNSATTPTSTPTKAVNQSPEQKVKVMELGSGSAEDKRRLKEYRKKRKAKK